MVWVVVLFFTALFLTLQPSQLRASSISEKSDFSSLSLCGADDRLPSAQPQVGRLRRLAGDLTKVCSGALIGKSCFVSAGHCMVGDRYKYVEFNTPVSQDHEVIGSAEEDRYFIDPSQLSFRNGGKGNDYAVMRLKRNSLTQKWPGDVQGYFKTSNQAPKEGETIWVTGYGVDDQGERHKAQQTHWGAVVYQEMRFRHSADTMPASSGSPIVTDSNPHLVGVHTNGGCREDRPGSTNSGTLIALNKSFQRAIENCLKSEE